MTARLPIVVVGQTPPPMHGQAVMIDKLVRARFDQIELHHVRMSFSESIREIGALKVKKLLHLAQVIRAIRATQASTGARVLYYPPAGPKRVPLYRDIAILSAVRRLFDKTIFHFHAGGITNLAAVLKRPEKFLFERAFFAPDGAIQLSCENPPDGSRLGAKQIFTIPYGIEDHSLEFPERRTNGQQVVLFVGALIPGKGVMVLLEAARTLRERGVDCCFRLMGAFADRAFEELVRRFVAEHALKVEFTGVLRGSAKWQTFRDADIFCFPSFYEAETFGVVVIEAMQFSLPVVATRWRGIQSIVRDGETGFLVETEAPQPLAHRLEELLGCPERATQFGEAGRKRFLAEYTLERWISRMEDAFVQIANAG